MRSPAVRGRGLKPLELVEYAANTTVRSPAVRGRGLKPKISPCSCISPRPKSPAVRGRGLKQPGVEELHMTNAVARCARAWVETGPCCASGAAVGVARCARAWVETRGPESCLYQAVVARCARAWVETGLVTDMCGTCSRSPAVRGRGLKRGWQIQRPLQFESPAVRGRGLKHHLYR